MKRVAGRSRTSLLVIGALVVLLSIPMSGALANAGGGSTTLANAGGGSTSFTYAGRRITTFFPGNYGNDPAINRILFVGLMRMDATTNKPVRALAQTVTSPDNKVWTIRLKPGWTFSNGEAITANTFANTWNFNAYGPNGQAAAGLLNVIEGYDKLTGEKPSATKLSGVTVVNARTLRVTLAKPFTLFRYLLASEAYMPLPRIAMSNRRGWEANPIGNGPYRVVGGFRAGATTIKLERWSGYKGPRGKTHRIVYRVFIDWGGNTVYNAVRAGSVDAAFLAGGQALASASRTMPQQVRRFNANAVLYLGFPTWDARFKSKAIRQAFSLAVNRGAIVRSLASGIGAPANGLVPPSVAGGSNRSCSVCTYQPARAKSLLAQGGGWTGGLTLWTYNDDPVNVQVIQAIANQWRSNLGIENIKLEAIPVGQLYPKLFAKEVDGPVYLYQGGVYPHVYTVAQQLLTKGGLGNVVAYNSRQVESLMERAGAARTEKATIALTQQAVRVALADAQIMPVYWPGAGLISSRKVSGVRPAPPYGNVDLEAVAVK
jgi:oligopeptide transport system substrate-binding protein